MDIKGKKAIVTGSGQGIGKGIALKLAEYGADIVVCDINEKAGQATVDEIINKYHVDAFYLNIDVTQLKQT